ncbi:MAG: type II toxin-antitoxin system HicA family toxin [Anaerolineales bacterium]
MKRSQLIKHLRKHGTVLIREGSKHTIFQRGNRKTQVPRHNEIVDELAHILRQAQYKRFVKIWIFLL